MEKVHHNMVASSTRDITVKLEGELRQFGDDFVVVAATPIAAISAVSALVDGFSSVLRRGRYLLHDGKGKPVLGAALIQPWSDSNPALVLTPEYAGSANGKGKALLGLTLLGLSFVPGASQGLTQGFTSFGQSLGGAEVGAAFGRFGGQLLGRSGALLMLSGAAEMLSPQDHAIAGRLPSRGLAPPQVAGQGAAMPLVYGRATVHHPIIISSGLSIETETK
jgi:predicted phage tail protein